MSSIQVNNWLVQLRDVACSPYAIVAICGIMAYVAYRKIRRQPVTYDDEDYQKEGHTKQPIPLKGLKLTRGQLAEYNSKRADKTYLVALHDVIYDVSSGTQDFGPGGKHAKLPGTEISGFIKKESRWKGRGYEASLNEWRMILEDIFHPAGKLIDYGKEADADTTMNSIPEESEDEAQDLQDEKDVEMGSQDFSSSCSEGDPGQADRIEGDRADNFSNEKDSTLVAAP